MTKKLSMPGFLAEIDEISKLLSKRELIRRVLNVARNLPEEGREQFLQAFSENSSEYEPLQIANSEKTMAELFKDVEFRLKIIQDGEKELSSSYNENWSSWYSDESEFLLKDEYAIAEDIRATLLFIHLCVDRECYREGAAIAELLTQLRITVTGDYTDVADDMSVNDFVTQMNLETVLPDYFLECLYLVYMGNNLTSRSEKIFKMMDNEQLYYDLGRLQEYAGGKLPEFDHFLKLWITYLSDMDDLHVQKLLKDAQELSSDMEFLVNNAKCHIEVHPELSIQILRKYVETEKKEYLYQFGMYVMTQLPKDDKRRSDVAVEASKYASGLKRREDVYYCWLEAFSSKPNILNFVRLKFLLPDYDRYGERIRSVYEKASHGRTLVFDSYDEIILFFDGRCREIRCFRPEEEHDVREILRVSKSIIALFIVMLYRRETADKGIRSIIQRIIDSCGFDLSDLFAGEEISTESKTTVSAFWELFLKWKAANPFPEEILLYWNRVVDIWIRNRVFNILKSQNRGEYSSCASFVTSFAEVQESLGLIKSKQQIMLEYKQEFPRHSAFHRELRELGLKDQ